MDLENNLKLTIVNSLETGDVENRSWNLNTLRTEFREQNLENLFELYVQKIQHGYFSLYLILQTILSAAHLTVLLINMKCIEVIYPDVICYSIIAVVAVAALFLKETVGKTCCTNPLFVTILTILVLITIDFFIPLYHSSEALLRPAYTTHIVIVCYVFLPISDNLQAFTFGTAVTICHLIILGLVTYKKVVNEYYWNRLGSDAVYMLCINGMGIYFRFMNEILKRRTFLDRRACVQSTLHLKHEEDQEEQLMLSILPQHIAKRVREDIKLTLQNMQSNVRPEFKPFRELYIEPHDNVTILYADIVRYTEMTRKLPVIKLVETLNELFGKFDDASEDHDVLRIKFLGDCYYCVSGIPVSNPNHATNCVELGLDMITIIQQVRKKRNLNIDMRIGVHSGSLYGGVIGECKWQYDIWSKDVDIANKMEQSGKPGKVHVTHHTLNQLNGRYSYVRSDASETDEYLKKLQIQTFLISPVQDESGRISNLSIYNRRTSSSTNRNYPNPPVRQNSVGNGLMSHRRTAFMSCKIQNYQLRLVEIENKLEEAIRDLPLRKFEQWFRSPVINPFFLTFRNWKLEFPYFVLPDPLFKYYLLCSFFILIAILAIQNLTVWQCDWSLWLVLISLGFLITVLIPFAWMHSILDRIKSSKKWFEAFKNFFKRTSDLISKNTVLRIFVYIVASSLIATSAILDLFECPKDKTKSTSYLFYCTEPWHKAESCALAIIGSFLFLRIHLGIKLLTTSAIVCIFSLSVLSLPISESETWNRELKPQIVCIISLAFLTFTLHLIDRQAEYLNRLDYEWKTKLAIEQKEAQTMHRINNLLLQNILPFHVAQHYLDTTRSVDELYHEQYKSVAVMFASVVDFEVDKDEIDTDVSASTIKIMNTVISEFDKLLLEPCGKQIEKIKVVGWTYMAACGLDPGRKDSTTSVHRQSGKNIVIQLVRFAVNMRSVLQQISGPFAQFKLRIGISHGEVTAGVVGSKKPLYDIWGDAVNMASRMDSTGEKGQIQITENTALILKQQGIECIFRGQTKIKSLDFTIPTYFIDLDSKNIALIENRIQR